MSGLTLGIGLSASEGSSTPAAPVNTALPSIFGDHAPGATLTANRGSWSGFPNPTFTYQWKRDGSSIGGATGTSYVVLIGDVAHTITVTVTATNSQGNASATSAGVVIALDPPVNTVLPVNSTSTPSVGIALSVTSGTWTGHPAPTYAYQWKWADTSANIVGATSASYTPVTGDVGHTLACIVTATNTSGSASATSTATSAVIAVPVAPSNTVAPALTSTTPIPGVSLSTSTGTWNGAPTPTYTYQWKYADTGTSIGGATSSSYTPVLGDVGHTLKCDVTATNSAGAATASSNTSGAVTASLPVNTVVPTISGTPAVGSVLTGTNGTWTGTPSPTFTYQWIWGDTGAPIGGATSITYTAVLGDVGHTLKIQVTGTNTSGNSTGTSAATAAVTNSISPPSGAVGIWFAPDGVGKVIPNRATSFTTAPSSPNLIRNLSSRLDVPYPTWVMSGVTATSGITAPDGTTRATRLQFPANTNARINIFLNPTLTAGQKILCFTAKSHDGVTPQDISGYVGTVNAFSTIPGDSTYRRYTTVFTVGAGAIGVQPLWNTSTTTAVDIDVCDIGLYDGNVDPYPVVTSNFDGMGSPLYLGDDAGDTKSVLSGGLMDLVTGSGRASIQMQTTASLTNMTAIVIAKKTRVTTTQYQLFLGSVSDFTAFGAYFQRTTGEGPNLILTNTSGHYQPVVANLQFPTTTDLRMLSHRYDGTNVQTWADDYSVASVPATITGPTLGDYNIASLSSTLTAIDEKIAGIMLWNRALSDAEMHQAFAYAQQELALASLTLSTPSRILIAEGDSLTHGGDASVTPAVETYAANASPALTSGGVMAWGGSTMAGAAGTNSVQARQGFITANIRTGRTNIVYLGPIGINDFVGGLSNATTHAANIATWCDAIRAAGGIVALCNLLPSTYSTYNTFRNATNAIILGWTPGQHYDYLIDVSSQTNAFPLITADAAPSNTTYYSDTIHLTQTGQDYFEANLLRPVLNSIP
jgi:hypothetical protein